MRIALQKQEVAILAWALGLFILDTLLIRLFYAVFGVQPSTR